MVQNTATITNCSYPDIPKFHMDNGTPVTNASGINFAVWGTTATFDYLIVID
jgi:hypothetical protein